METNFEHYKDELIKVLLTNNNDKCDFFNKYILPYDCKTEPYMTCIRCQKMVKEWLDKPYTKPKIEIDWSKVPVDTPVIVSNRQLPNDKFNRYFSEYKDKQFYCFRDGTTSWTTVEPVFSWTDCELARPEDIEKYRKK